MKKKYLLILGLLAVLVLVAGCGTSTGEAVRFGKPVQRVPTLNQDMAKAKGSCYAENQQIDKLKGELDKCNDDMGKCDAELGDVSGALAECNGDMGKCNAELGDVSGALADCNGELSSLKDKKYYVTVSAVKGEVDFKINDEEFELSKGQTEILADGSTITHLGTGNTVDGEVDTNFHFAGGCPTNYNINAVFLSSVKFIVNGYTFYLKEGQTKAIPAAAGGGNVALEEVFFQGYAGGKQLVQFVLHC